MPDQRGDVIIKFKVEDVSREVKKIDTLAEAFQRLNTSVKGLEAVLPVLGKLAAAVSAMGIFSKDIKNLATAMNKLSPKKAQETAQALSISGIVAALFGKNVADSLAKANNSFSKFAVLSQASLNQFGNVLNTVGQSAMRFFHYLGRFASRALFTLTVSLRGISQAVQQFGSVIRMVGQGLQNFGMTMTFFIAMPVSAALRGATSAAVAFDDALVKIRKTTSMTWEEIGRAANAADILSSNLQKLNDVDLTSISTDLSTMSGALLEMARYTPTPIEDLGQLAEEAGRLGIRGTDNIMAFVQAANMIGVATDISATDAIKVFSRLLNASGDLRDEAGNLLDSAGESIMRLATTVNMLENTTMGSASNITDAMERMIASSAQFDIPVQNLAAFAATLYELGLTAETAGTTFERVTTYMAVNIEDLAIMTGQSIDELRYKMDTDFTGALLGVLDAFRNVESETEAAGLAWELFGVRAQRGVALLSNAYERLYDNLENANDEFSSGTSLVDEYFDALQSTDSQMKILQNNLKVASIILGQQFLPTINKGIQLLVAAIQLLTEAWGKLSNQQKLMYVGFALLAVVIPPVAIAIGSVLFVIGMFISAVGGLIGAFVSVAGIITNFAIPALAALTAALVLIPDSVTDIFDAFNDTFQDLISQASRWGSGLMRQIAVGILSGLSWIVNAAWQVANVIASFFRTGSPPERGPLSDIDTWGSGLMNMILMGFSLADFSLLETAGRYIAGFFDAFSVGGDDINALNAAILGARDLVKQLIDMFNRTGEISQAILSDISNLFGEIGQHVADLLVAQFNYNRELERQEEIEKQLDRLNQKRKAVLDTYDEEVAAIAASGASAAERVAAFREAREERDEGLAIVDDEIDAAQNALDLQKDAVDAAYDQVQWQQALLDALLEEARLRKQINDEERKRAGELPDYAGALPPIDLGLGLPKPPETEDIFGELELQFNQFKEVVDTARIAVLTFWAALTGQPLPEEALAPPPLYGGGMQEDIGEGPYFDNQLFANAYEAGERLNEIWTTVRDTFNEIKDAVMGLWEQITKVRTDIENADFGPLNGLFDRIESLNVGQLILLVMLGLRLVSVFAGIGEGLGFLLVFAGGGVKLFGRIIGFLGTIAGIITGLLEGKGLSAILAAPALEPFVTLLGTAIPILGITVGQFLALAAAIAGLIFVIIKFGPQAWENLKNLLSQVGQIIGALWDRLKTWAGEMGQKIREQFMKVKDKILQAWDDIKTAIGTKIDEIKESIKTWFENAMTNLFAAMGLDYSEYLERWGQIWEDIKEIVQVAWDKFKEWIGGVADDLIAGVMLVYDDIVNVGSVVIGAIVEGLTTAWESIKTFFIDAWPRLKDGITAAWESIKEIGASLIAVILLGINDVIGDIVEVFGPLVGDIANAVGGFFSDIFQIGKDIVQGIIDGILSMAGELIAGATTLVEDLIAAVKEWLGIASASQVFTDVGENIVQGILDGISNLWESLMTKGSELIGEFTDWFSDIYDIVTGKVQDAIEEAMRLFTDFKDTKLGIWFTNLIENFETAFETIKTTITGLLKGGINIMLANVESAINGIIDGINAVGGLIMRLPGASALLGGIFPIGHVYLPRLATGGIVMSPITAIVGDVPGGEAVVPLRKLPVLMSQAFENITPTQTIHIRIDRVDASDKEDVDALIERIRREMGRRAQMGARLGTSVIRG